jgi:general secretion pathway protein H
MNLMSGVSSVFGEKYRRNFSRRNDRISMSSGFSLVELLVVLLIIGLGFSMASINVGSTNSLELQSEAKLFANRLALISEEAVLSREQWGVDIYREAGDDGDQFGYRWLMLSDNKQWLPENEKKQPADFLLPSSVGLKLELEGRGEEMDVLFKQKIIEQHKEVAGNSHETAKAAAQYSAAGVVKPAIWMLSNGEMSGFSLTLFDRDNLESRVIIVGDELGRIKIAEDQTAESQALYE